MAVFGIIPDAGIQETWEWRTDILTSIKGDESRLSVRDRPRLALRAQFSTLKQRSDVAVQLHENIKSIFETPIWPYAGPITQTTTSGLSRVYFENSRVPVAANGILMLINPRTGQAFEHDVTVVETDGATLATPVATDITTEWIATPGFEAKIVDDGGFSLGPVVADAQLEFQSYVDPALQRPGSTATLDTLDSITVLDRTFLEGAEEKYQFPRETLDFGAGLRVDYSRWAHARLNGPHNFVTQRLFDPTDMDYWRLFFDTVKGGWKPFLLSTQFPDMTLSSGLSQSATSMIINENIGTLLLAFNTWRYFEILYTDGTTSQHIISSTSGSGPTTVNFSPALPADPKVSGVSRISHLLKSRMADRVTITHGPTASNINFETTTTDDG